MQGIELDRTRIQRAIAEAEARTSGEIRVVVYPRGVDDPVETAREEFRRLAMHRTKDRNAVLILVAPASHAYAIFGDSGVHAHCGDRFWRQVASAMGDHFRRGEFTEGVERAIHEAGSLLAHDFPRRPDDSNELPDEMIERGIVI